MNNRIVTGILGVMAVVAIIFAVVQSQNLTNSQNKLATAQTAAAATLNAAKSQAVDAQNEAVTIVAQAVATGQVQMIATSHAQATTTLGAVVAAAATTQAQAQNDAATRQAKMLSTSHAQLAATLGTVVAAAATKQDQLQNDAATAQAQMLSTSQVQAAATLGTVVAAAATKQDQLQNDAATAQAQAVESAHEQAATEQADALSKAKNAAATAQSAALDLVQNVAATRQAGTIEAIAAEATDAHAAFSATQAALESQIAALQSQAQPTLVPTVTVIPTEATATTVPTETTVTPVPTQSSAAQTPKQLCDASGQVKDPETRSFTQAEQVLQPNVDYYAILCTDVGPVTIDLLEKDAPATVNNFVFLAQKGYYNNTTFHRVLEDFMAQGGDPTGTGTGDAGYKFNDEIVSTLNFDIPGRLAMANSGPNTNGSQFFITFGPQINLNGGYTIFGQVVEGQANVRKIELRDPTTNPVKPGTSLNTVLIVTDPTKVLLTDTAPPTQADVVKALDGIDALVASDLAAILENNKISQTTAEVIGAAPADARKDVEALLTSHNHQYRVGSTLSNKACDTSQIQFYSASYTLDAFATANDAAAAINDGAMEKIALESGFTDKVTSTSLTFPYFTAKETFCDKPVIHAMTYWRRGNFIVTSEVIWPAEGDGTDVLDKILGEFVGARLYEPLLVDVLYSNIQ